MRLWPRSVADRIKDALDFLTTERGYRRVAASDAGMAGSVGYRSDALWITAEWDRGEPRLVVTPVGTTVRAGWEVLDPLLRGAAHYDGPVVAAREAPPAELAAWLRAHLDELEARLHPPRRAATLTLLAAYEAERQAEGRRWWDEHFPPRGVRPASAGPRAP